LKTDQARKCRLAEKSAAVLLLFALNSRLVSGFVIGVTQEAGSTDKWPGLAD
jgi:hypothetical protein